MSKDWQEQLQAEQEYEEQEFHLEATTRTSVMATDLDSAKEWFEQELATNRHIDFDIEES